MARVVGASNQFLEVIRHTDKIPLDLAILKMDSGRVQITRDEIAVMHVLHAGDHHSKHRDNLLEVESRPLAECLPVVFVVGRLSRELDQALLSERRGQELICSGEVEQILVTQLLHPFCQLMCGKTLLFGDVRNIHKCDHL